MDSKRERFYNNGLLLPCNSLSRETIDLAQSDDSQPATEYNHNKNGICKRLKIRAGTAMKNGSPGSKKRAHRVFMRIDEMQNDPDTYNLNHSLVESMSDHDHFDSSQNSEEFYNGLKFVMEEIEDAN